VPESVQTNVRIERVLYAGDRGWTVTRASFEGAHPPDAPVSGQFAVVGELGRVTPGDVLAVRGDWVNHREYGVQLKTTSAAPVMGGTEADLVAFLARMPQIGRVRARLLMRALGGRAAVLAALEDDPERLTVVDGITLERAEAVAETYRDQVGLADALTFLGGLGLGERLVGRVLETWEGRSRKLIEHDPYILLRVSGLDFKRVDEIARSKLDVARDDDRRCRAAAAIAVRMAEDEGHVWSPAPELDGSESSRLAGRIRKAVELTPAEIQRGLTLAEQPWPNALGWVEDPLTVRRHALPSLDNADVHLRDDVDRLWSAQLDFDEQGLAEHIVRLVKGGAASDTTRDLDVPGDEEIWKGITPAPEQAEAVAAIAEHRVLVTTGGPGVGKTFTVNAVLQVLERNGIETALCAPTGKAAQRMKEQTGRDATTIHRLLGYVPGQGFRHDDGNVTTDESGNSTGGPLDLGAVVVDESSMVDTGLFHALVRAIPNNARLIIVGDVDQLPSIGAGRVLHDLIESGIVPVCRLTKIFRTAADSRIPYVARDINAGKAPDLGAGGDVMFIPEDDPETLAACIVKAVANVLPTSNTERGRRAFDPIAEVQVMAPQKSGPLGVERLNRALQERLNPGGEQDGLWIGGGYRARIGDRVIHVKNNYRLLIFNGEMGTVAAADYKGIMADELDALGLTTGDAFGDDDTVTAPVSIDASGRSDRVMVVQLADRLVAYGKEDVRELLLGYAITVHKSQGSQFPCVVLPVHAAHSFMLTRSLLYTAVTRASELVVLYGQATQVVRAAKNTRGTERRTTLQERLQHAMSEKPASPDPATPDLTGPDSRVVVSGDDKARTGWFDQL